MTFLSALGIGLVLVVLSLGFQTYRRRYRHRHLQGLELRPNCLLTRYPIVFLCGRRSLFRPFDYWNDVPVYLREHGYEVLVIEPPLKKFSVRRTAESFEESIQGLNGKCHVIADASLESVMRELARVRPTNVATMTMIRNPLRETVASGRRQTTSVEDLKPRTSLVETFDLGATPLSGAVAMLNVPSMILLKLHNAFLSGAQKSIDAIETGELISRAGFPIESKFLDLAVQLAERDARGER